jgi:hypothetical protein
VEGGYYPEFLKRKEPKEWDFTTPLLLEPGEGWCYGASTEWTGALSSRILVRPLGWYIGI